MGCSERTRRGDAITSWCNELSRGWRNERTVRGNAATSWWDKMTRGQCNERTGRGNTTTSWRDKTARGWRNEGTTRRCNNQLVRQDDTRAARQEATQPRTRSAPNEIDWQCDSHGHSLYQVKTRTIVRISGSQLCGSKGPQISKIEAALKNFPPQNQKNS